MCVAQPAGLARAAYRGLRDFRFSLQPDAETLIVSSVRSIFSNTRLPIFSVERLGVAHAY